MQFPDVVAFARWFLQQPIGALRPPKDALIVCRLRGSQAWGSVLHRGGQFQVEIFSVLPDDGARVGAHRHPNVDSIEFFLSGEIGFAFRGRRLFTEERLARVAPDGASAMCGKWLRVRETELHSAEIGPGGGTFLSIQHWLHGVAPSSVLLDWEGEPHLEVLAPKKPAAESTAG